MPSSGGHSRASWISLSFTHVNWIDVMFWLDPVLSWVVLRTLSFRCLLSLSPHVFEVLGLWFMSSSVNHNDNDIL